MQTQWYLCEIDKYPNNEETRLKPRDNLSVKYPETFRGSDNWFVWLPIIPRVGDTLQFNSWQVQVSKVILETDFDSETGIKEGHFVSAKISIRDDLVLDPFESRFSVEKEYEEHYPQWENYACRGNDLQYYAWELQHEAYLLKGTDSGKKEYYRWHTRIRPVAGDIVAINKQRWKVKSVELASANLSIDGWLTLTPLEA